MTLSSIDRLAHKTWARQLRASARALHEKGLLEARVVPYRDTWSWLAAELVFDIQDSTGDGERFQGLFNVEAKGSDPRRAMRRIRVSDVTKPSLVNRLAKRRPSGRAARGLQKDESAVEYHEVYIDLVDRGDLLVAGASRWIDSPLWRLVATRRQPDLEDLRALIRELLTLHGLCRLPPAHYALSIADCAAVRPDRIKSYRESLAPLICQLHPDSICLLAALTLEAFIIGHNDLLELHREALCTQIDRLLLVPHMADLNQDLRLFVVDKLVNLEWEEAPPFAAVSIDCPLTPIPSGLEIFP